MAKNRKAAEKFIIDSVEEILPGGGNKEYYEKLFKNMSDSEFDQLMQEFESGESRPVMYAPNFAEKHLDVKRNLDLAQKHGHNFFEKIWIGSANPDEAPYLTNNAYMVIELPIRRQAQLLTKKISVPENNRSIDQLTGQPSGNSKSASISYPELQVMRSMGLDKTLLELIKFRGGDIGGYNAMNKAISQNGAVSMKAIEPFTTGVESTSALKTYLTAMHLKNTL